MSSSWTKSLTLFSYLAATLVGETAASRLEYKRDGAFDAVKAAAAPRSVVHARSSTSNLEVDLGYATYKGFYNDTAKYNTWLGVRYAAPPTGQLRWQPPQAPAQNGSQVINANVSAPRCPQSGYAPYTADPCPGLANDTTLPASCANSELFKELVLGSEDCLFLNVFAPPKCTACPVLIYIHGGGYGEGFAGESDFSEIIAANNFGFIAVAIQYRLGAFGFLSSDEVYSKGVVNAGLLDQHFSMQWVQTYIHLFGGDPTRVTIAGESAGAGSVMLQAMAYDGSEGTKNFQNLIAASPYLPGQFDYNGQRPTLTYQQFAAEVGCNKTNANETFSCLVGRNSEVLQQASAIVSADEDFGSWAFLPVTDVNGLRTLSGNNANEGPLFVPGNITTEQDFVNWVRVSFPLFTEDDVNALLDAYPISNDTSDVLFATDGVNPPYALDHSTFATGQQQRADNVYAESVFVCPSYWLANAFGRRTPGTAAYKYQFSIPPAYHSSDLPGYTENLAMAPYMSRDFQIAFEMMWGNFIIHNTPAVDNLVANGNSTGNSSAGNPLTQFPGWNAQTATYDGQYMMNLNESGGTHTMFPWNATAGENYSIPIVVEPGLKNAFSVANAYTWEGGRGKRCEFWQQYGAAAPE